MGFVHAEIELINANDLGLAKKHEIGEEEVRRIKVTALADTGCMRLAINENIQEYLQLNVVDKRSWQLANNEWVECDEVGPLEVRFGNRREQLHAIVLPGNSEVLLGVVPMELMDVLIDPARQELIVNPKHPAFAVHRI